MASNVPIAPQPEASRYATYQSGASLASMSWDGLVEIFNPGHQHLREERDRKRIEAQIPGSEGDGLTQVDLEHGVVRIPAARPEYMPVVRRDDAHSRADEDSPDNANDVE